MLSNCSIFSRRCLNEHEGNIFISGKDLSQHLLKKKCFWTFIKFVKNVKERLKGDVNPQMIIKLRVSLNTCISY